MFGLSILTFFLLLWNEPKTILSEFFGFPRLFIKFIKMVLTPLITRAAWLTPQYLLTIAI